MKVNLLLVIVLFVSIYNIQAQKGYVVTYSNTYAGGYKIMLDMLPKESKLYIKGKKSRAETQTALMDNVKMEQIVITDYDDNSIITLVNVMGQKSGMKSPILTNKINQQVLITDKTKNIAGFDCKKVFVISEKDTTMLFIYEPQDGSGSELAVHNPYLLPGIVMEQSGEMMGVKTKTVVTKLKKTSIPDKAFQVPLGVKVEVMSEEKVKEMQEKMKMFGSGK